MVAHSRAGPEHVRGLAGMFERFTLLDLKLTARTAHLGGREDKFMGHRVNGNIIAPDWSKVDALTKMNMPTNVSQVRSLLREL